MTTYAIRRMFFDENIATETIKTGLSLEEAQAHCQDPETSSTTAKSPAAVALTATAGPWFDGYDEEQR